MASIPLGPVGWERSWCVLAFGYERSVWGLHALGVTGSGMEGYCVRLRFVVHLSVSQRRLG